MCGILLDGDGHLRYLIKSLSLGLAALSGLYEQHTKKQSGDSNKRSDEDMKTLQGVNESVMVSGVFWSLAAADVLLRGGHCTHTLAHFADTSQLIPELRRFVMSCWIESVTNCTVCSTSGTVCSTSGTVCSTGGIVTSDANNAGMGGDNSIGGFGSSPGALVPDVVSTLNGLQCLRLLDSLSGVQTPNKVLYSAQEKYLENFIYLNYRCGYFTATAHYNDPNSALYHQHAPRRVILDLAEQPDVRHTFCALASLHFIQRLENFFVEFPERCTEIYEYVCKSQNIDGGFGCSIGNVSHAGYTFCSLAVLKLLRRQLPAERQEAVCGWLHGRQQASGGLNGRIGKDADSCYSWWVVASLVLVDAHPFTASNVGGTNIDLSALREFVLTCQVRKGGMLCGFCRNPKAKGSMLGLEGSTTKADVFHTCFAICSLSLLNKENFVDAVFAMPHDLTL
eukprot:Lankesteria_metandrocarpae@DN4621_c0_g1_i1.p2